MSRAPKHIVRPSRKLVPDVDHERFGERRSRDPFVREGVEDLESGEMRRLAEDGEGFVVGVGTYA